MHRIAALLVLVFLSAVTAFADDNPVLAAPSKWAEGPTGKVHYKSWGKGSDALVLIHGWTADMSYYAEQVPHFADRMRVIAIDLPGHGASDKPEAKYTQALFAESIAKVLDHAKVKRTVLVGHSMGMATARQFYRLYPKRTLGIVSLDGAVKTSITDPKMIEGILSSLRGPSYPMAAAMIVDGMFLKAPDTKYKKHIRDTMLATPQHVVASAAEGMFDLSLWNDEPIDVPMIIINAPQPVWTAEYEAYARKLIPKLDYVMLEGVSHFLHTEKPAEVNALIDGFLAKHRLLGQKPAAN
ncbi:MAG: alpha/beta hydrolase [Thermoanaerobaculia bacterium]